MCANIENNAMKKPSAENDVNGTILHAWHTLRVFKRTCCLYQMKNWKEFSPLWLLESWGDVPHREDRSIPKCMKLNKKYTIKIRFMVDLIIIACVINSVAFFRIDLVELRIV